MSREDFREIYWFVEAAFGIGRHLPPLRFYPFIVTWNS